MKLLSTLLLIIALPVALVAQPANDVAKTTFVIDNGSSTMVIEGGSTVGSWDADVKVLEGEFKIDMEALGNGVNGNGIFELSTFSVPVGNIESDSRRMNRNIYSYLKEDDHPNITFTMTSAEVTENNGSSYEVLVNGVINAAGADHEVSFTTEVTINGNGSLVINGKKPLNFSDFGIDRPSAMLGTVRADEEIEIVYNLVLTSR
ncbi:MAG: YceI family protein [Balneolia bacterium]|nr:YceI family protein [Balneolia bacterium]